MTDENVHPPSKIEAGENTAETPPPPGSHVSGETYAEKHGELRRLRAVRGLSTRAMAAEIGISAATLNRAENGETVSVDVAAKLGPYIGECLCCGQPVWAPPQSNLEGDALTKLVNSDGILWRLKEAEQKALFKRLAVNIGRTNAKSLLDEIELSDHRWRNPAPVSRERVSDTPSAALEASHE